MSVANDLSRELDQINREYTAAAAGRSRLHGDLAQMDTFIKRAKSVIDRAQRLPTTKGDSSVENVREAARSSLAALEAERGAIVKAKEIGPIYDVFRNEAILASFVYSRYFRHFAGQNRATRDRWFLAEMIAELKGVDERMSRLPPMTAMPELARDREVVKSNLEVYRSELLEITKAHSDGDAERRAATLAELANHQFELYRVHFAGESRLSRRPNLLQRIITALEQIKSQMWALNDSGPRVEFNANNILVVSERMDVYRREIEEINRVQRETPLPDIIGDLARVANSLMGEYTTHFSEKPRTSVDLAKLGGICDKLHEARSRMAELTKTSNDTTLQGNLSVVTDALRSLEREYSSIHEAQSRARQADKN